MCNLVRMNRACIMKFGWALRIGKDGLWARILRNKYGRGSLFNNALMVKPNDSTLWKDIAGC